jgi:hypothetical protein
MYPKIDVVASEKRGDDGEDCRGADGKKVYPGVLVTRPPFHSEGLRCTVPVSWGKVKRLYRQEGLSSRTSDCEITVETMDGRYFWLDTVRRTRRLDPNDG